MLSTKQSPALAPEERYRPALAPERVRSCRQIGRMTSQSGWIQGLSFLSRPLLPLGATFPHRRWASAVPAPRYNQSLGAGSWIGFPLALEPGRSRDHALLARGVVMSQVHTPPLQHGVLHASSGLGGVRAPEEAAEGAVGNNPLGVQGFFSVHLEGARSIASPRRKPPLSTARAWVSVPPSSRIHPQFPCHQWCRWSRDHLSVGILGLVWLAGCWQLLHPLCANLAACTGPGRKERGAAGGRRFQLLWVRRALILSWEGTALPLIWEKKGREEEHGRSSLAWFPRNWISRAVLVRCQEGPGVHLLLRGPGSAEPGTRDCSLGGDGGLRGLGVIGSDPARTRPQLLRRALHSGCHPLPADGWRCRRFFALLGIPRTVLRAQS